MEKSFLVASNENQSDILFWWLNQCKKFHPDIPIQVVDLGLSSTSRQVVKNSYNLLTIPKYKNKHTWFNKPRAMLESKSDITVWMDIDTEFVKNINDIFEFAEPSKIGLVNDQYYHSVNRPQYNTGVVLYSGKPKLLFAWDAAISKSEQRGDQEVLLELLQNDPTWQSSIKTLQDKYNYGRLAYQKNASGAEDLRVVHWTGPKGKEIIRGPKKMGLMKNLSGSIHIGHDYDGDVDKFIEEQIQ